MHKKKGQINYELSNWKYKKKMNFSCIITLQALSTPEAMEDSSELTANPFNSTTQISF